MSGSRIIAGVAALCLVVSIGLAGAEVGSRSKNNEWIGNAGLIWEVL
jgi:hypothetical protein